MKLFYVAAYGPKASDPVWDHFLLAEDEAEAKSKASGALDAGVSKYAGGRSDLRGYTVQKVREMKLPPSHHFAKYPLLGAGMTVGEWWKSIGCWNTSPEEGR